MCPGRRAWGCGRRSRRGRSRNPHRSTSTAGQSSGRALASEYGPHGVTVNAIAPGLVRTPGTLAGPHVAAGVFEATVDQQPIKRTLTPDDVVGAMAFLVSDDAAMVTGQCIAVDGGRVML